MELPQQVRSQIEFGNEEKSRLGLGRSYGIVGLVNARPKVILPIVVCLAIIYVGSYSILSGQGQVIETGQRHYEVNPGGDEYLVAPVLWVPKYFYVGHKWNYALIALYYPLLLIDRAMFHIISQRLRVTSFPVVS